MATVPLVNNASPMFRRDCATQTCSSVQLWYYQATNCCVSCDSLNIKERQQERRLRDLGLCLTRKHSEADQDFQGHNVFIIDSSKTDTIEAKRTLDVRYEFCPVDRFVCIWW